MKFLLPVIIAVMTLFAPLSLAAAEKKVEQHIKSIFFQKSNDREIVQVRLSGKVDPKVFELGGEKPRVVLDFITTGYEPNKIRTIKAGGVLVNKIRVGLHAKPIAKTRVVIDMVEEKKYTFTKEYTADDAIFRITFSSPQVQKSEQQKSEQKKISTEQMKTVEPVTLTDAEDRKIDSANIEKELQASAQEKNTEESKTAENTPALVTQELETIEEKEGSDDAVNREVRSEETQEDSSSSVLKDKPEVEDEKTQILLDVTYEKNTNGNEMVLFHLNGFYPPVVYSAESGELLVVCEFLDAELGRDDIPVITKGGRYIRQVKVEPYQQPKKVRVVIELADSYNYDLKQVFFKEDNLFVIVLNSLGVKKK